uniref:Uncharacterized protein n=1 Tax=Vitis vinifera TaxID=29760 RepID=F6HUT5_VITVI
MIYQFIAMLYEHLNRNETVRHDFQ